MTKPVARHRLVLGERAHTALLGVERNGLKCQIIMIDLNPQKCIGILLTKFLSSTGGMLSPSPSYYEHI